MHPKLSCLPLFALVVLNLLACSAFATENAQTTFGKPSIDLVVVIKSTRTMYLYADGIVVKRFPVSLGAHPVGDKHESGDERTPEGHYILDWRNPDSLYHLSIHISYPNAQDIAWARAHGVDPGDNIMIHGQPNYAFKKRIGDWTHGCIAVSNHAMDYIWQHVPLDTPIQILP